MSRPTPVPRARLLLAALACSLLLPLSTRADEGGLSLLVLSVGKDSASQKSAAVGAFVARGVFARNPRYSLLDVEQFLDQAAEAPGRALITKGLAALEKGGHALDENELDTAISSLNDAAVSLEQGAAYVEDIKPYVDALLRLGSAYALNAEHKPATEAFRRALLVDRAAAWDKLPPQAQKAFDDAGRKVDEGDRYSINVFSTPSAAEVYVDGVFRGATPLVVERLAAGPHVLRVVRAGHRSAGKVVKVSSADETVQFPLKPTLKASELETILNRVHTDVVAGQGPVLGELARFAKVDQVYVQSVQSTATDVRVAAVLVDNTGSPLGQGERGFTGDRYRDELDRWIEGGFRTGQAGAKDAVNKDISTKTSSNYTAPKGGGGGAGMGKIVGGALLLPVLPLALVIGLVLLLLAALCWYLVAGFRLPGTGFYISAFQQTERTITFIAGIALPIVAVVGALVGAGFLALGIALMAWGFSEKQSMDAILAGGGGDAAVSQCVSDPKGCRE
ncbi:MAG: PEGA domain-containing protein [Deltaproteobacteria bacterium]|nr:PEGA domain-containing protein [Deltaproteobacteria bacterium]